jgi:hypothetical protein
MESRWDEGGLDPEIEITSAGFLSKDSGMAVTLFVTG